MSHFQLNRSLVDDTLRECFGVSVFVQKPTPDELLKAINEDGHEVPEDMILKLLDDGEIEYTDPNTDETFKWNLVDLTK